MKRMDLQKMSYGLPTKTLFLLSALFLVFLAKGMEQAVEAPVLRDFPLHVAAAAGDSERIRKLVKEGKILEMLDELGNTPLHCAAEAGKIETIDCLIKLGANLEALNLAGYTPIMRAKLQEMRDHLKKQGAKEQVFVKPAALEVLRLLVRAYLEGGNFPLHWAAKAGQVEVVKLLLAAGADKEAQDKDGFRPLHRAADRGHVEVVKALLAAGAEKEAQDIAVDSRPLHLAAEEGYVEVVQALLAAGVEKEEALDKDGNRPLHLAADRGHGEVVKALLAAEANKEAVNKCGRSGSLIKILSAVPDGSGKPMAIIAHTIKGKGVSVMEDDNNWHYRIPNAEEVKKAKGELKVP